MFSGCIESLKPPEDRFLSGTPDEQKCLKYFEEKAKDASKGNIEWDALCQKYESSATSAQKQLSGAPTPTSAAAPASVATVKATPAGDLPSAIMTDATLDAGVIYTEVMNVNDPNCPDCYRADEQIQHVSIGKKGDDLYFRLGLNGDINLDDPGSGIHFRVGPLVYSDLAYLVQFQENNAYLMVAQGFPEHPFLDPTGRQRMIVDTTHPLKMYNGGDKVVIEVDGLYKIFKDEMNNNTPTGSETFKTFGEYYKKTMSLNVVGPEIRIGDVLKQLQ